MFTKEFKLHSKKIIKNGGKKFTLITLINFIVFYFFISLPIFINYINSMNKGRAIVLSFDITSVGFFAQFLISFLGMVSFAIGTIYLFTIVLQQEKSKKSTDISFDKAFWCKTVIIITIFFALRLPFDIISKLSSNYIRLIALSVMSIIDIVFAFTLCVSVLNSKSAILDIIKKTLKTFFKYILGYFGFELSFILWYIIPFILMIIIAGFSLIMKYQSVFVVQMSFYLFSPLMYGIGIYFFPYYNISKLLFVKQLLDNK